jgi:hypothetical protein
MRFYNAESAEIAQRHAENAEIGTAVCGRPSLRLTLKHYAD